MKKIFLISVFIVALSLMSCEKDDTNTSIIPTPENPSMSFVDTKWNAHLSFTETVSGSPTEFEFDLSMTFYSDSTGLIEQTTIKPFNDVAQFSFTYDFDGISSGNMYGQQLHPMILLYEKEGETITLTRDDYSEDEHMKFDQIYHRVTQVSQVIINCKPIQKSKNQLYRNLMKLAYFLKSLVVNNSYGVFSNLCIFSII